MHQNKDFKIRKYENKRENYHIGHRIDDLKNMLEIQGYNDNRNSDEYMRGMFNGLLLAWNTLMEPYEDSTAYADKVPDESKN